MKDHELYDWIVANPGLAELKESSSLPGLAVAKYKRKVFYDDLWNRQLEECRGAVFDMESKKIVVLQENVMERTGVNFTDEDSVREDYERGEDVYDVIDSICDEYAN